MARRRASQFPQGLPLPRPELAALLAAAKDDPDDLDTRLVVADWLEEHGGAEDRERAAMVRDQVAHDRELLADPCLSPFPPETATGGLSTYFFPPFGVLASTAVRLAEKARPALRKLRNRAEKLNFGEHLARWEPIFGPNVQVRWRRGMLALGAMAKDLRSGLLNAVAASEVGGWVESLRLTSLTKDSTRLRSISLLSHLAKLELAGPHSAIEPATALLSSPHLARLRRLDLTQTYIDAEGAGVLATAPHFRGLRELRMRGTGLGYKAAASFLDAARFEHLRLLALSDEYGGEVVTAVARAEWVASLECLDLSGSPLGDGVAALATARHLNRLRVLLLDDVKLTLAGLEALLSWPGLSGLHSLSLSAERGFMDENEALGDDAAIAVASCPRLANLVYLGMKDHDITDRGALALAASPHLKRLRVLDFSGNAIGPAGVQALVGRDHFPELAVLSCNTAQLGDGEKKLLRARFGEGLAG